VVIVGGVSPLDQSYLATARQDLEQFEGPVEFTYLTDLPIDEIERRVSVLPEHSIVFFVTLFRDSSGHSLPAQSRLSASRRLQTFLSTVLPKSSPSPPVG